MTAQLLNGKALAEQLREAIKIQVQTRIQKNQIPPGLAVIIVGEDPASHIYVRNKRAACEAVGFYSRAIDLPKTISQEILIGEIQKLNQDPAIHGILVQLPLPAHIDTAAIIEAVDPRKDVDGFHPYNTGRLSQARPMLEPCTPKGIMTLLKTTGVELPGKHAVIVGASNIVGRPMASELLMAKCTVTVCHSKTQHLPEFTRQADILIVAVGKPHLVQKDWVKPGAIVIDVGMNHQHDKLVGDVDFETVKAIASWITPVPGGVGPMTVVSLLQNTLMAAEKL